MKVSKSSRSRHRGKFVALCLILVVLAGGAVAGYWAYQNQAQIAETQRANDEATRVADAKLAEIEAKKKEPVYITLPGADKILAPAENYEDPTNIWTLVNKERALPDGYIPPQLVVASVSTRANSTADEKRIRKTIDSPVIEMFSAAQKEGHSLMIGSAYRSAVTQDQLFNRYVADAGYEQANKYSAHPGHSEHQTGLAIDISTTSQQCYLSECFINTADGQWLAENAHTFGFHLRYQKGKEAITGYNFEPWHYRYVGRDLATALHQSGLTLDEAWPYLEAALATLRANNAV